MAATGIIPTVDYVIKRLFGTDENKALPIHFLNAILATVFRRRIVAIEFLRTVAERELNDDKLVIVDIHCVDETGRRFVIEMQVIITHAFCDRLLYYWAVEFRNQLPRGADYSELRPTIFVCISLQPIVQEADHFHQIYELRSRRENHLFSDRLEIHTIDLSRFLLAADELKDDVDRWTYFFKHGQKLDPAALPESLAVPEIHQAVEVLDVISKAERERQEYEHRLKVERDLLNRDQLIERKGVEQGRQEGRKEGRQEGVARGVLVGRINTLQEILGLAVSPADELDSLSAAELEAMASDLRRRVQDRPVGDASATTDDA